MSKKKNLRFKLKTVKKNLMYYTGTHAHFCKAEAWSALQLWEARVCIDEAHGVQGFPPSPPSPAVLRPQKTLNRTIVIVGPKLIRFGLKNTAHYREKG